MLLEAKEDLRGVDRFNEIIGYLLPDRLLHDMFLFRLGDHHNRHFRMQALDLLQGLQTRHTRHVLIQENDVELIGYWRLDIGKQLQGILTIGSGDDFVTFAF